MSASSTTSDPTEGICPIFKKLNVDDDPDVTEMESLCLQCGENGITRLLLTKIPFYKEVVIMSFTCNSCHWDNNELQPASTIQEKGIRFKFKINNNRDLNRVVVKTEWACIKILELKFEIPSKSQEGAVTTIEGILDRTCTALNLKVDLIKKENPEAAVKLQDFINEVLKLKTGEIPFTFILEDISGNSYLENLCAPQADPQIEETKFARTREEDMMLGMYIPFEEGSELSTEETHDNENLNEEVLSLPTNCFNCNAPCITNMKLTQIPHFKDVVIMSTTCEACDHKTNEIKSGCGLEPHGIKATLTIRDPSDLTRDVVKSDSCRILIKELELDVGPAAFGSRYSTVEGLLTTIKEQLQESNPFISGDSADLWRKERLYQFLTKIDEIISLKRVVTFVMDDPTGNSYLQSIDHPNPDTNLVVEKYERSMEQDEELGILDMKVENYEES